MRTGLLAICFLALLAAADEPPDSSIPVLGIRINRNEYFELEGVTLEHLAMLSWRYFDGVDAWGSPEDDPTEAVAEACAGLDMLFVLLPGQMIKFLVPTEIDGLWFRWNEYDLGDDSAFVHPTLPLWNDLDSARTAEAMWDTVETRMDDLDNASAGQPAYWFFGLWDEANTNQRAHIVVADDPGQSYGEYYGYYPDMFTQARSLVDGTPTMEEIDPEGVFSWLKWTFDSTGSLIPVTTTLGTLLTYSAERYPGLPGDSDLVHGTLADMGRCVRAIRDMECRPQGTQGESDNAPEFICFNRYPFRQVDIDIETEMGDTCWIYLIDQAEESMDSVVMNAGGMPVFFYTQLFGGFGGPNMRDQHGELDYQSLMYRQPSIAEFRMLCNLALMHGMKGIFPYDIRSYHEWPGDTLHDWIACSLLDWNLIPFDAPYEEWAYSGRLDEDVCRPDSIPPFNGYDPLFELDEAPIVSGERGWQNYYVWKYTPFANIWNGIRDVLGEVKTIGPEIVDLDLLDGTGEPGYINFGGDWYCWGTPEARIFTNDDDDYYLYYVNRCCVDSTHEISFWFSYDSLDVPSIYALDHSRRIIVSSDLSRESFFSLTDTLEAGQGRLLEFIPQSTSADLRITEPDVWAEGPAGETRDYRFMAGDEIEIYAVVYNLGTTAQDDIDVTLYDITEDSSYIDSDVADLAALSKTSGEPSADTLSFIWETDSTDIGAHIMEIRAESWQGEPSGDDNWVRAAFLIDPRDYATEVLGNAWDMKEATVNPPAWKTLDVDSLLRWDTSAWTDSIGGMFEGRISSSHIADNRMYIHMPTSSSLWIDGDLYNQFSLIGKSSEASADIILGWTDSEGDKDSVSIGELTSNYGCTEVFDLSAAWAGLSIKRLWIGFRYSTSVSPRIRIGSVSLEEEKP